jgi:hypothetical protein
VNIYFQLFFFVMLITAAVYGRRRKSATGRRGVRQVTGYGIVFCVLALNLWFATRFEDISSSFPSLSRASIFAAPWLWISALCVGVALLTISFFTRKSRRDAA